MLQRFPELFSLCFPLWMLSAVPSQLLWEWMRGGMFSAAERERETNQLLPLGCWSASGYPAWVPITDRRAVWPGLTWPLCLHWVSVLVLKCRKTCILTQAVLGELVKSKASVSVVVRLYSSPKQRLRKPVTSHCCCWWYDHFWELENLCWLHLSEFAVVKQSFEMLLVKNQLGLCAICMKNRIEVDMNVKQAWKLHKVQWNRG